MLWLVNLLCVVALHASAQTLYTIGKDESMGHVLSRSALSKKDVKFWLYNSPLVDTIERVRPGERIELGSTDDKKNQKLIYHYLNGSTVAFIRSGQEVLIDDPGQDVNAVRVFKSFTIQRSLTEDGKRAGLSYSILQSLADIFAWELDFKKNLRIGDQVQVVYEKRQLSDSYTTDPQVVFARIKQKNKRFEAIRYVDEYKQVGYYNVQGRSLTRSFLRKPLDYRRISSPFSSSRRHPVLGANRPHYGVDLAARRGAPVWATGEGEVIFAGQRGGYGKTVVIRHNSRVSTLYGHLDKIEKNIKRGTKVMSKQPIGTVGSTGIATGPHLHYEFRIDNTPMDPMTIELPAAKKLAGVELLRMLAERQQWLSMVEDKHARS